MGQLAIIAEYNPFHNGHQYLIEQAKRICDIDSVIAIMSGNFLQRGEAALWNKFTRATMACKSGIDCVLELPFPYATGSAHDFATGAIALINKLNTVSHLAFGVETDDFYAFEQICSILADEPSDYKNYLQDYLSSGYSYPSAREAALSHIVDSNVISILKSPNNILAIEYLTALKRTNSSVTPVLIKRTGANYHDTTLDNQYSSASGIRACLSSNQLNLVQNQVPPEVLPLLPLPKDSVMSSDAFMPYIQGLLLHPSITTDVCDFTPSIRNKFIKSTATCSYSEFIAQIKTKEVTHSRIARALLHAILLYTESDRENFIKEGYIFYANILALKKASSNCLKEIQDSTDLPLITKKADFEKIVKRSDSVHFQTAKRMWELDQKATDFYNTLYYNHYGITLKNDFQTPIPIIE